MNFTQREIQQNIQAQLPVIPNNGNPAGAYNMPPQGAPQQPATANPFAWLEPSQAMASVRSLLDAYQPQRPAALPMNVVQPPQAVGPAPILPMMQPQQMPMNTNVPVIPTGL